MVARGMFGVWRDGRWVSTDARWIRSVVTLQAPLKGTRGAEFFSARYNDEGVELPKYTAAHALSGFVLLYDKLAPAWMQRVFEVENPYSSLWRDAPLSQCLSHSA